MKSLTHAARLIGENDLSTPVSLERRDELGHLALALEQTRTRLADSFGKLEHRREETAAACEQEMRLTCHLQLLHDSALAIGADLSLEAVLQQIVDRARELWGALYAALGVTDSSGGQKELLTSGITPEQRAAIGPLPHGGGLLGAMLQGGEVLSLGDIRQDPRSVGFPPHHPPMTSFLGTPITSRGRVLGALYLTDKVGAAELPPEDRELIARFSAHAAIAIENATLPPLVVVEGNHICHRQKLGLRATQNPRANRRMRLHDLMKNVCNIFRGSTPVNHAPAGGRESQGSKSPIYRLKFSIRESIFHPDTLLISTS